VADLRPIWPDQTLDDDKHDVRDDEVMTTTAQHMQVGLHQDTIECEDTIDKDDEDDHFITVKVKKELGHFFDRKNEARISCAVFFSFHNANPDEAATWRGKNGIINKIRKVMELPAKAQLDYILQDAFDHQ
jgi:hypothetical protein